MANTIRAWITNSTDDQFLKTQRARVFRDDILVTFDAEEKRLISIEGNKSNYNSRQIQGVDLSRLEAMYGTHSRILIQIKQGGIVQLLPSEWESLKTELKKLANYIADLESAQRKNPELKSVGAIAFDLVRASIEMFKHTHLQNIRDELKQIRREVALVSLLRNSAIQLNNPILELFNQLAQLQGVNHVPDNHPNFVLAKRILHGGDNAQDTSSDNSPIENAPPRRERHIISREQKALPGYIHDNTFYERHGESREWNDYGVRLVDPDSGRDLYIFLSHQEGIGNVDAIGSDLIYISIEHRSFLLVQYKLLGDKNKFNLNKGEREQQLQELLDLCSLQGCDHLVQNSDGKQEYVPANHIRSGSCPVFYKLVGEHHKILADNNFMEGRYVPACMIRSLIDDRVRRKAKRKYTLDEADGLDRGLDYSDFIAMAGKSNMGSKASAYDSLLNEISGKLNSSVMLLALVDIHQAHEVMPYNER
jgi:hypothetical protein